jgi:hypothetical protein
MGSYKCSGCDYTAHTEKRVLIHINKKDKCSDGPLNIERIDFNVQCDNCGNTYKSIPSLHKHKVSCDKKKKEQTMEEQIKKMSEQITELQDKLSKQSNTTINNSTINNNNNTIVFNSFENTKYDMKEIEKYLTISLSKNFNSVNTLVKYIHFNEKYPENYNLKITNPRTNLIHVRMDNNIWDMKKSRHFLKSLIAKYEDLMYYYAQNKNTLEYVHNYEKMKERSNDYIEKMIDNLILVIYNESNKLKQLNIY